MKIASIEYHPTSTKGGSEKAFFEALTGLKHLGHDITVFYVKEGNYLLEYDKIGIKHQQLPDINIRYLSLSNWIKLIKASSIINNYKPDVIYINQLADALTATVCKLRKHVNIVCHIRVPKQGNSKLFNFCGKFVDQFICVNHLIKKQYQPYFNLQKLNVVNDGINIPLNAPLPPKKTQIKKVAFLGRLSPEKGILELLETWLILKEKYNLKIVLDITGPADSNTEKAYKEKIIANISEKNLEALVKVNKPISNPFEYFQNYDLSVFPSVIDESFGRTLPESILAGTPVFARKVGIVEDILAPLKDIFTYRTEAELAHQIFKYYTSGDTYDFKNLQLHILGNYNIEKNVILIENILKKSAD